MERGFKQDHRGVLTDGPGNRGWLQRLRAWAADATTWRELSVHANDGTIATAGTLEGFAGAGGSHHTLLLAAFVTTLAGALTLGGAEWAEQAAERDAQVEVAEEEAGQLAADPEAEMLELAAYWEGRGLSAELAAAVAEQLTAQDALAAQLDAEHGIRDLLPPSDPPLTGISATIAYLSGAAIPLLIAVFAPIDVERWLIFVAAAISLACTSVVAARGGRVPVARALRRSLAVGIGTMLVSLLVGMLLF